jgi:hypothetical protein
LLGVSKKHESKTEIWWGPPLLLISANERRKGGERPYFPVIPLIPFSLPTHDSFTAITLLSKKISFS